jgi:hypothetical protein
MKLSHTLKMCLNYKVLGGIAIIIVLVYLFAPHFAGLAPLLLFLVCPLSMILMMAGMQHGQKDPEHKKTDTSISQ